MYLLPYLPSLLVLLLPSKLPSVAAADSKPLLQTIHLSYRSLVPSSLNSKPFPDASSFTPLAALTYSPSAPHNARVVSLTAPPNTTEDTSIAFFDPKDPNTYRSTVTATRGFHAPFRGRFRIMLSVDGSDVLSASYHSFTPSTSPGSAKGSTKSGNEGDEDAGEFDIVFQARAQPIFFEKPVKKGQKSIGIAMPDAENEDGEKVEEKTFLQKYWWLLLGVLAVTLLGPGEK